MANHSVTTDSHGSTPVVGQGHGSHDGHDIGKAIRTYLIIFGALIVGTILTVWASYIDFGTPSINIVVALAIAIVKGGLVAGFFMHLVDERKVIYGLLIATVFFFSGLMYITLWSMEPLSFIHFK
jgi:cytochrome c oxidase subunit 4